MISHKRAMPPLGCSKPLHSCDTKYVTSCGQLCADVQLLFSSALRLASRSVHGDEPQREHRPAEFYD